MTYTGDEPQPEPSANSWAEAGRCCSPGGARSDGIPHIFERDARLVLLDKALTRGLADAEAGRVSVAADVVSRQKAKHLATMALAAARFAHDTGALARIRSLLSILCIEKTAAAWHRDFMKRVLGIIGRFVLLAAIMIAAPQTGVTATTSAPMMEMADGSHCPPKDCATMRECPMALPGGVAMSAIPAPYLSVTLRPGFTTNVFAIVNTAEESLSDNDGLRRPPKI